MNPPALLFAGGGTGGHIYPALAIREALAERLGSAPECVFLCSGRAIDRRILEREGVAFEPLPAQAPGLRPRALARFLAGWGPSVRAARARIRAFRRAGADPIMVATGGFVAAPAAQAARVERCPVHLIHLDDPPGKANRFIARFAARAYSVVGAPERCSTAKAGASRGGQPIAIAPIVRRAALAPGDPVQCRHLLGLDPNRPTLLVLGGSQGARTINQFIARFAGEPGRPLAGWQLIHQTGADAAEAVRAELATLGEAAPAPRVVEPYVDPVGPAWGAADLAICRAGAGTVAEAWANRVPAIFLPYPFHTDQHQRRNAEPLARAGGALILEDLRDPEANLRAHGAAVAGVLGDPARRAAMRQALAALGPVDGAARVAAVLLGG